MTVRNFDFNRTAEISTANHLYPSCLGLRSIVYPCITTSYRLMPSSVNPPVLTEIINVQKHGRFTGQNRQEWQELFVLV